MPVDFRGLGRLLEIELGRLVKMGPSGRGRGRLHPAGVLQTAQEAAASGLVGIAHLVELRRRLTRLESSLVARGAWAEDRPLWWRPLPDDIGLERTWSRLEDGGRAAGPPPEGPSASWVMLPDVLSPEILSDVDQELRTLVETEVLELDRGTVGEADEISPARSDEVLYLSGREPELLQAAPRTAATIQWCLTRLVERAVRAVPAVEAHAPERAMLARYPAPSAGFRPHLDNPGGERDNGRSLSLVLYLNAPARPCRGGELALWAPGDGPESEPAVLTEARGGSAALFDARTVLHEVRPLRPGPARWSLAIWLNDGPQPGAVGLPIPGPDANDVLLSLEAPPLPADRLLLHRLDGDDPRGLIVVRRRPEGRLRAGIVSTVYGAGETLNDWCRHHVSLGFEHLILVFDGLEEPEEAALASRLRRTYPARTLTIWSDRDALRQLAAGKPGEQEEALLEVAGGGRGAQAVSARQTLNATAALRAARSGRLGDPGLDWLLHLDADEYFHLQGPGRGGDEVGEHFAAVAETGIRRVRYLNHELLGRGRTGEPSRYKINPRLASARLGARGWAALVGDLAMDEGDTRPYFHGYVNGKSAVAVPSGVAAAGVHGWTIEPAPPGVSAVLAGPSVLHHHLDSAQAFCRKYTALAMAEESSEAILFEPYRADRKALDLARELLGAGASPEETEAALLELHRSLTWFSSDEIEVLEAANLLLEANP